MGVNNCVQTWLVRLNKDDDDVPTGCTTIGMLVMVFGASDTM